MIHWTALAVEAAILAIEMTDGSEQEKMEEALKAAADVQGLNGPARRTYKKVKRRPDKLSTAEQEEIYRKVVREELERFNLTWDYLQMGGQMRPVVDCRWTIIWRVRKESKMSYPEIGKLLDLDHTTVLNAYNRMEETGGRYYLDKPLCAKSMRENRRKLKKIDEYLDRNIEPDKELAA
jgi:chromosomal replication initiation ATPase DnaA